MLYDELLKYDLTYDELYNMTLKELTKTLEQRRKGLAYIMWKQSMLTGWSAMGKDYPKTPEEACPELFPRKRTIKMPNWLKEKWLKKGGVK